MTIITETLTEDRVKALISIGHGDGLTSVSELSENVQQLFDLDSSDSMPFASALSAMREHIVPSLELEAAYYALGVDVIGDARSRREVLLSQRHGESWDVTDSGVQSIQERRGFYIIASSYDLAVNFQKLIAVTTKAANMLQAGAGVRKMLNTVVDETTPKRT